MKKPLIYSLNGELEEQALQSLRNGENGSEWSILERLVSVVVSGKKVDPVFQYVVNAIIAKAVISEKLPNRSRGRPANIIDGVSSWEVADRYLELRDGGLAYSEAVALVADEFHKDERHIMRLVREGRPGVERRTGATAEERSQFRKRSNQFNENDLSTEDAECVARVVKYVADLEATLEEHLANEAQRDYLADIDGLIYKALSPNNSTDMN